MPSLLDVYNTSASHASVGPALTSENDAGPIGQACRTHFYPIYDALIQLGAWPWAIRRAALQATTLYQLPDARYRDTDGYVRLDQEGLASNVYRYELPINYYGYGDIGFSQPAGHLDRVKPIEIAKVFDFDEDEERARTINVFETPPDDQARWIEEGSDLISTYTDEPRPASDDADRGDWIPSLTLRFVASVQVAYANGPFVEALQAFLGAVLARKFREHQQSVQDLLVYGGAQLQLALRTLPDPVNYDAITFFTPLTIANAIQQQG